MERVIIIVVFARTLINEHTPKISINAKLILERIGVLTNYEIDRARYLFRCPNVWLNETTRLIEEQRK